MLNRDHPDEERLSALAAGESDESDRASLSLHMSVCAQCQAVVRELRILRTALAELPDLAPHRPLRLLPAAAAEEPSPADRLGQWARRLFAPALTAGAALAMVGVIGISLPALSGLGGGAAGAPQDLSDQRDAAAQSLAAAGAEAFTDATASPEEGVSAVGGPEGETYDALSSVAPADEAEDARALALDGDAQSADRSPWPMVLFAGVALMIGAGVLRWIVVPQGP